MEEWRRNLIEDDEQRLLELLHSARRVAVLGIKTEAARGQPAFYVPQALQQMGLQVVPVPVYYPEATQILGEKVYRRVADVPGDVDIVDVFRRSRDVAAHFPDLLAKKPRAVWLQSGIRDDRTAEALARAGMRVVQDRCLMVDYRAVAHPRPGTLAPQPPRAEPVGRRLDDFGAGRVQGPGRAPVHGRSPISSAE